MDVFSVVLKMIAETEQLWKQVKEPPMNATDIEDLTHSQLIERPSLIKIYYCTALARISLNVEVLAYPTGTQHIRDLITYLFGSNDDIQDPQLNIHTADKDGARKMSDTNLHKIFLPLMSALELCEMIRPEWLCHMAIKYLADYYIVISSGKAVLSGGLSIVQHFIDNGPSSTSVEILPGCTLLYGKRIQLTCGKSFHCPSAFHYITPLQEVWAEWALICLRLIQRLETLLDDLRCRSPLVVQFSSQRIILNEKVIKVLSFRRTFSRLFWTLFQITAILVRLSKAITCDWGEHTEEIKELASSIISKWRHLYIKDDIIGNSTVAQWIGFTLVLISYVFF